MSAIKILCPKCGRILGDTDKNLDGLRLNCPGCRKTVQISVKKTVDDFNYLERNKNDKPE